MGSLNLKRFAVSLGIVGAVIAPILTGSFKAFSRVGWRTTLEDDQQRYLAAHGMNPWACLVDKNYRGIEPEICDKSQNLAGQNLRQTDFFDWDQASFIRFLMSISLGFLVPFAFVLMAPRIARAYFRWVTSAPK